MDFCNKILLCFEFSLFSQLFRNEVARSLKSLDVLLNLSEMDLIFFYKNLKKSFQN